MEMFTIKVPEHTELIWRPEFFTLVAVLLYNIFLVRVLTCVLFPIETQLFLGCVYAQRA